MDDLTERLTTELREAAEPVLAGDGLTPAIHRAVRRRRIRTAIGVAVPAVLLLLGAAWLIDTTTDDASEVDTIVETDMPEPEPEPTPDPEPEPEPTPDPEPGPEPEPTPDPLRAALEELGAAIDTAPEGVADLGEAEWCGFVVHGQIREPNAAAHCFSPRSKTASRRSWSGRSPRSRGTPSWRSSGRSPPRGSPRWSGPTRARTGSGRRDGRACAASSRGSWPSTPVPRQPWRTAVVARSRSLRVGRSPGVGVVHRRHRLALLRGRDRGRLPRGAVQGLARATVGYAGTVDIGGRVELSAPLTAGLLGDL